MDLFDPKPKLNELHGQAIPDSLLKNVRFAFIQKETARLMGSPRKFKQHGQSGMVFSDLLPNIAQCADDICMVRSMHTESFNHHPGQLFMNTGLPTFGRPSMGSWLNYGLGCVHEVFEQQMEEVRLRNALERINNNDIILKFPDRLTPLSFPIIVDGLSRYNLSSEKFEDRVKKMQKQLEK